MWIKYPEIERLGKPEVKDVLKGTVYIFEKLDGANVSFYWDNWKGLVCCSRNREVFSDDSDGDFREIRTYVTERLEIKEMVRAYPNALFYGEYLVKHQIIYPLNIRNKVWFFDIFIDGRFLSYVEATNIFLKYGLLTAPMLTKLENPTEENLKPWLNVNKAMGIPGQEGIIIKNYEYFSPFTGRQQYAKIVNPKFSEAISDKKESKIEIEKHIAEKYTTEGRINKFKELCADPLNSLGINLPKLFELIYHDILKEEIYEIVKYYNNPILNFKHLKRSIIDIIKAQILPYL